MQYNNMYTVFFESEVNYMRLDPTKVFLIMAKQNLTQKKLSELSGYSCNAVRAAIKGNVNCKPATADAIAKALNVPLEQLI